MQLCVYSALVEVAAALVGGQNEARLKAAFSAVEDWQELASQAEIHGLSVMLGRLVANADIDAPRQLDLQLKALTVRHQKVLQARKIVLAEVIALFEKNQIQFAFLKGAALAQLIYDPAWLRPMRDIDVLVSGKDAARAQTLLREIGFENDDFKAGYLFEHHHLPNSIRMQGGFTISLEVHHDALSGDVDASITLDNLSAPLLAFEYAGETAYAFGHTDTLKHLCYHSFEPAETIKLGSMVDMVRYAAFYAEDIDWPQLGKTHPYIGNALRCVHALIPLPEILHAPLAPLPGADWQVADLGHGFTPLSQISKLSGFAKFKALMLPSEWWMHIFHAVPPEKSLLFTRLVTHPITIIKWLLRRYRAAHKSKSIARDDHADASSI